MVTIVENTVLYDWNLLRVELKCSHIHTYIYDDVHDNLMVRILSQCNTGIKSTQCTL